MFFVCLSRKTKKMHDAFRSMIVRQENQEKHTS